MTMVRLPRPAASLGAVAFLVLASCGAPPSPATGADREPRDEATETPGDATARIESILMDLPVAWNARDAEAWVAHFGEASGFTNILGMHFPDRAANQARHAQLFATIFANSTLEAEVLSVELVGEGAAVAELEFTLVGYSRLPPDVDETEPGVLRTRLITVFERRADDWVIVAAQNTAILPAAVAAEAGVGSGR